MSKRRKHRSGSRKGTGKHRSKGRGTGKRQATGNHPGTPHPAVVAGIIVSVIGLLGASLWVATSGKTQRVSEAKTTQAPKTESPARTPVRPPPRKTRAKTRVQPPPEKTREAPTVEPPPKASAHATVPVKGTTERVVVKRVVDGDTFYTEGGEKIRLLGINTPERKRPLYSEASAALRELIGGQEVTLEYDYKGKKRGQYKRVLAYIHCGGVFVNGEIVRRGLAYAYIYPDTRNHRAKLIECQQEAQRAGVGLWAQRRNTNPTAAESYIGNRFAPYFHVSGCRMLRKLSRRPQNKVEFDSRQEALDAGMNPCDFCKS